MYKMATDAFGRLRTSEPFTTFNYYPSPMYNDTSDNDVWIRDKSTNGDILYDSSNNLIKLTVTAAANEYAIRTTKVPMDYQPGKSRLIMMSGVMIDPVPAAGQQVYTRMGLINVASPTITDGVWFEVDGSENKLCWCQSIQDGNGSYTIEKVYDVSWNVDTFNGTGPSGKTLTMSSMNKNILIIIDQEWLGVGRLRCGFNIDGVTYYAHTFTHGNLNRAYTASPKQRLGYEILTGTVAPTSSYTMKQICSTCISEGGFFPLGTRNCILSNIVSPINTSNILILAIKLKSGNNYKNGLIKPINLDIVNSAANTIGKYELRLLSSTNNVTIGTQIPDASFNNYSNSIVRYYSPPNNTVIITGGYILSAGYVTGKSNTPFVTTDYETLLSRFICTQYDTLAVVASNVSGNPDISATIDFIESL